MNLATRLFITFAILIALSVGSAIGLTYWLGRNTVENQIDSAFITSQSVQRYFLQQETRELELISELIASDRAFVAYISQALNVGEDQPVDIRSVTDLLNTNSAEYGFDFAVVLSPDGVVQVETGDLVRLGEDLSERELVATTLQSLSSDAGLWFEDQQVLQVAITPLLTGRTIQAYLLTGSRITNEFVGDLARISGIELAYASLEADRAHIATSTLRISESEDLAVFLSSDEQVLENLRTGRALEPRTARLAGQDWIMRVVPLVDASDNAMLVSLVPEAQLFKAFKDISNVLVIAGLMSILLALVVSVTASRSFLKPIDSLIGVAEDATRGEYQSHIDVAGSTELRRLERAFNRMVSDLREQQAAEVYFEDLSHKYITSQVIESKHADDARVANNMHTFLPGKVLGNRFEILQLIGKGGMGVVYEAIDRELDDVVAIKTLRPELLYDEGKIDRLKAEIRLARRITHPNIVRIFEFAQMDGVPLISMEYIRGIGLEDAIRQSGRVNYYACLRLALQICDGIAAAHRVGVLHRDIKPANVIITHQAKVMDFGIARPTVVNIDDPTDAQHGKQTVIEGTAAYLAPEQLRGEDADERSDIYSLGILLTQMFTGKIPHDSTDTERIFKSHLNNTLMLPSQLWSDIPQTLEAIILQCLELSPDDRWQSVADLREAINLFRVA